ncbi:MAG TPA: cell division protein ZapA [Bryobacteraceae bacterium]|nr:cell division protein ZapA [Bryobacteraceae bacterium]
MPKQPVRVHIFNQSYTVVADDNDANSVQEIAHQIDDLMATIASHTSSADSTRVAVLACLHLADKLRDAERRLRVFEDQSERISSLLDTALDQRA